MLHGRDHINQASQLQENSRKVALRVRLASPPTALVSVESLAHPPARKVKSATVFDRYAGPGRRHVFRPAFTGWPLPEPSDWAEYVNLPQTEAELEAVRRCLRRACPYGTRIWAEQLADKLGLQSTLRRADVARIQTVRKQATMRILPSICVYPLCSPMLKTSARARLADKAGESTARQATTFRNDLRRQA